MIGKAILLGEMVSIDEHGSTNNGEPYVNFTLRTWETSKDKKENKVFHTINAYGAYAETILKHFEVNKSMYIDGMITSHNNKYSVKINTFRWA